MTQTAFAGVILAGGASRRMGGHDKAFIPLAGRPLIAHVIDRLAPQTAALAINANNNLKRFRDFRLPVVADEDEVLRGPLAGILAAIRFARGRADHTTHVLTASCDAPFLPEDLAARLAEHASDDPGRLVVASSTGRLHPVCGLWPVALADRIREALANGEAGVTRFAEKAGAAVAAFPAFMIHGIEVDPFTNLNTPEELAEAEQMLAFTPHR